MQVFVCPDRRFRGGQTGREPTYYAVSREPGRGWDSAVPMREQARWDEHAAFMNNLEGEGRIVLGGPVGDAGKLLLIVRAVDEREVHALLASDPWTPIDLLPVTTVERWTILLGTALAGPA